MPDSISRVEKYKKSLRSLMPESKKAIKKNLESCQKNIELNLKGLPLDISGRQFEHQNE